MDRRRPARICSAFLDIGYLKPQIFLLPAEGSIYCGTAGVSRHPSTLCRFLPKPRIRHREKSATARQSSLSKIAQFAALAALRITSRSTR
jgi:hypothetical protein